MSNREEQIAKLHAHEGGDNAAIKINPDDHMKLLLAQKDMTIARLQYELANMKAQQEGRRILDEAGVDINTHQLDVDRGLIVNTVLLDAVAEGSLNGAGTNGALPESSGS